MSKITPEMIEKAKAVKCAKELVELAKTNGIEMTDEEAKIYYAQLNPKAGELDDDELETISGGGCQTSVGGEKHTVVTCGLECFNGKWQQGMRFLDDGKMAPTVEVDNVDLRLTWAILCGDRANRCGTCIYLEFKDGLGYCSQS